MEVARLAKLRGTATAQVQELGKERGKIPSPGYRCASLLRGAGKAHGSSIQTAIAPLSRFAQA